MKSLLIILFFLISSQSFGQWTYEKWVTEAKTNIRLRPKYGLVEKTKEQKEVDQEFIASTMNNEKLHGDRTLASNQMIELGFQYLYKGDLKTAMYRFNQAYLLDSANADVFWGYGAIYMTLSNQEKAREQYEEGLKLNAENTRLLTDYGTYFFVKYFEGDHSKDKNGKDNLDRAIEILLSSYRIDTKNQNTLYKLSVCYLNKKDCENARKVYNLCKDEGGQPIAEEFTTELNKNCP